MYRVSVYNLQCVHFDIDNTLTCNPVLLIRVHVLAFLAAIQCIKCGMNCEVQHVEPFNLFIVSQLVDLQFFLIILVIVTVAFGVISESIQNPNSPLEWLLLWRIIYKPYWNLYGELFLEEFTNRTYLCKCLYLRKCNTNPMYLCIYHSKLGHYSTYTQIIPFKHVHIYALRCSSLLWCVLCYRISQCSTNGLYALYQRPHSQPAHCHVQVSLLFTSSSSMRNYSSQLTYNPVTLTHEFAYYRSVLATRLTTFSRSQRFYGSFTTTWWFERTSTVPTSSSLAPFTRCSSRQAGTAAHFLKEKNLISVSFQDYHRYIHVHVLHVCLYMLIYDTSVDMPDITIIPEEYDPQWLKQPKLE